MKHGCLDFGAHSEPVQVEGVSIKMVPDPHTMVIILEGVWQHGREYHAEEGRCKHTARLMPFVTGKVSEHLPFARTHAIQVPSKAHACVAMHK